MLSPEFAILFYLENNNYTIKSLRSTGIHPQKAKNAIENLKKIGIINDLGNGVFGVTELITSDKVDLTEQIIDLRKMLQCVKDIVIEKEKKDFEYYKNIKYLFLDEQITK